MLHIQWVTAMPCVSEPFEKNNVARAVHEKIKFDAIKATFAEVHASPDNCTPFILSFFLQADELFLILLLLTSLCLRSHVGYYRTGRTWTRSSQSEPSLTRSHAGDKGSLVLLDKRMGVFYLKTGLSPETTKRPFGCAERGAMLLCSSQTQRLGLWMLWLHWYRSHTVFPLTVHIENTALIFQCLADFAKWLKLIIRVIPEGSEIIILSHKLVTERCPTEAW